MGEWSPTGGLRFSTQGADTSGSDGTSITLGATLSEGNWTEIASSTPYDADGFTICIWTVHDDPFIFDVGIGAASSEVVIVENMLNESRQHVASGIEIPIAIPAGTRIAVRGMETSTVGLTKVQLTLYRNRSFAYPDIAYRKLTTYGVNVSGPTYFGTRVDPGGTANTLGSWVEITSSTTNVIQALQLQIGNSDNLALQDTRWLVDIGVGGAGSETIIIDGLLLYADLSNDQISPAWSCWFPVTIPAGTRIAVRCQCTITDATDRMLDVVLAGVS